MRFLILSLLLLSSSLSFAQGQKKADFQRFVFGLQYKPILPVQFFGINPAEGENGPFSVKIEDRFGAAFGMVVRANFSKLFAYEFGINYIRRNYRMEGRHSDLGLVDRSNFAFIGYEIPNQFLVYIQLSDTWYMNTAFGLSITSFASDVASWGEDQSFSQQSFMAARWFALAGTANLGFEYRSPNSGYFYFGASLHWPFRPITYTFVRYRGTFDPAPLEIPLRLTGRFLTLDLRYFFDSRKKK